MIRTIRFLFASRRKEQYGELKRVLELINRTRVEMGLKPVDKIPEGQIRRPGVCSLSRALDGFVGVNGVFIEDEAVATRVGALWNTRCHRIDQGGAVVQLPPLLQRFITNLDRGKYPFLVVQHPVSIESVVRATKIGQVAA